MALADQRCALSQLLSEEATRKLIISLDDEQLRVVLAPFRSPLFVSAGPGAGKTRALTARVAAMVAAGAPPSCLFLLTFSRTAMAECAARLAEVFGVARAARIRVRTFHGAALLLCHRSPALAAGFLMEGAAGCGGGGGGGGGPPTFPLERFSVISEESAKALFFLAMLRVNAGFAEDRVRRAQEARRAAAAAGQPPLPPQQRRPMPLLLPTPAGRARMEAMLRGDEPVKLLGVGGPGGASELATWDVSAEGVLHVAPAGTLKFGVDAFHRDLRKYGDAWRVARYWGLHLGHLRAAVAAEAADAEARGVPARVSTLSVLYKIATVFTALCLELGVIELTDALRCGTRILETDDSARAWVRGTTRSVLCDEFQDVNSLQWRFLTGVARAAGAPPVELALAGGGGGGGGGEGEGGEGEGGARRPLSITVVGDAKQSIMGFQGAFATLREHFFDAFPQPSTVALTNCYRSTLAIVGAFNALMGGGGTLYAAPSVALRAPGEPIRVVVCRDLECEAQFLVNTICERVSGGGVRYRDVAVLARSNRGVNQLAHVFRALGIPYARSGASSHPMRMLRSLSAALRAVSMRGGEEEERAAVIGLLRACSADLARSVEGDLYALQRRGGGGGGGGGGAAAEGAAEGGGGGGAAPAEPQTTLALLRTVSEAASASLSGLAALEAVAAAAEKALEREEARGEGEGGGGSKKARRGAEEQLAAADRITGAQVAAERAHSALAAAKKRASRLSKGEAARLAKFVQKLATERSVLESRGALEDCVASVMDTFVDAFAFLKAQRDSVDPNLDYDMTRDASAVAAASGAKGGGGAGGGGGAAASPIRLFTTHPTTGVRPPPGGVPSCVTAVKVTARDALLAEATLWLHAGPRAGGVREQMLALASHLDGLADPDDEPDAVAFVAKGGDACAYRAAGAAAAAGGAPTGGGGSKRAPALQQMLSAAAAAKDAVAIGTVHSAKGTERAIVFIARAVQGGADGCPQFMEQSARRCPLPHACGEGGGGGDDEGGEGGAPTPSPSFAPPPRGEEAAAGLTAPAEHVLASIARAGGGSGGGGGAPQCLAEERRIFYVATSRAKDALYITWPATEDEGSVTHQPSCFLAPVEATPHVQFLQQLSVSAPAERVAASAAAGAAVLAARQPPPAAAAGAHAKRP